MTTEKSDSDRPRGKRHLPDRRKVGKGKKTKARLTPTQRYRYVSSAGSIASMLCVPISILALCLNRKPLPGTRTKSLIKNEVWTAPDVICRAVFWKGSEALITPPYQRAQLEGKVIPAVKKAKRAQLVRIVTETQYQDTIAKDVERYIAVRERTSEKKINYQTVKEKRKSKL